MNRFGHGQTPRGRALYRTKGDAETAALQCSRDACSMKIVFRQIKERVDAKGPSDSYKVGQVMALVDEILERFNGKY